MHTDPTHRTALVTGANSGLGFEAAAQLAELGYGTVILACRTLEKAEGARQKLVARVGSDPFDVLAADVANIASSKDAAEQLVARGVVIDALLLNAGMVPGDELTRSADGLEMSFAASLVGHHVITMRLLAAGLLDGSRVVIAGSEAANDDLPGLFGMAPYPLQDADSMRQFVHGKSEPFDGTRTYSTTKQFVAWWSASVAQRYGDRFQVFTVSPGSNMSTNAARNVTGFKRFLFTKVMPAIGPLMGMDQPVALGAGRYIDVLNATDGRFESGRTYTSAPKKMTGPLHPVEYAHLRDVSRQDAAWGVLQEVSAAAVPKENLGRGELG